MLRFWFWVLDVGNFIFENVRLSTPKACARGVFLFTLFSLLGCAKKRQTLFAKLDASDTGIDFVNVNHETERSNILSYEYFYNGGGTALGDINNDGLVDVYLTSNIFENKLYLNKGNFKFEDITKSSGTSCEVGWKTGVSMVDINADGYLDIYVCRSASPDPERRRNLLFINNRNNTFTEKAKEYQLDDPSYSTQAAFFDYDRDGDLDAFLLNHSTLDISNSTLLNPKNEKIRFPNVGNRLLRNDNGKFHDVSDSVGIYGPASNYGLGVSLSDINNDGWIDIYAGCDYTGRDQLLINKEGRGFIDGTSGLSHISKFTMGTDIADVNGDGLMDILTLDMLPEDNYRQKQLLGADKYDAQMTMVKNGLHHQYMRNMLHLNQSNGTFSEIGQFAGISNTDWSWGGLFADFDNDGSQDVFITNGFKRDLTDNDFAKFKAFEEMSVDQRKGRKVSFLSVINKFKENKLSNYMFRNDGQLHFENVTEQWGLSDASLSNGVAYGDLDNDGDLDLVINNVNEAAGIYRNNSNDHGANGYLIVKISGKNSLGAKVTVFSGGKQMVREQLPVRGFQSSVDSRLHFGIGANRMIDSLIIRWADGSEGFLKSVRANQSLELTHENVQQKSRLVRLDSIALMKRVQRSTLNFRHRENEFVDFREQALLPRMYSRGGPGVAVGDINNDGVDDLFLGGAKGQRSELWAGTTNGFAKRDQPMFNTMQKSEITDAAFFDADGDRDVDLYIVTGGYEFPKEDPALQDFLLINGGRGNFEQRALPDLRSSGSCVRPCDFDLDGDMDLFVGGRIVPGRYPETPTSFLLINNGKAEFAVHKEIPQQLVSGGMITDALWEDLNGDKFPELITVGEWMPINIFGNDNGRLIESTSTFFEKPMEGFWNCLASQDIDADGDTDLVVGNQGLNTQMHASIDKPITLVYDDFDGNGSIEPILNYYVKGVSYPYATRDELTDQIPSFKKRFTNYSSYSKATLKEVLTAEELSAAKKLSLTELRSGILRNDKGRFTFEPLPSEAQFAPISAFLFSDIDNDGREELLTGGNLSGTRSRSGKMTGNVGFVFRIGANGRMELVSPLKTGISVSGDVKKIAKVNGSLLYIVNDNAIVEYKSSGVAGNSIAQSK